MEVAYEILIDGLKKYGAEIIGGSLAFVTFWLWRRYQKKIISGLKFLLLFVLAVIAAAGLYAVVSVLGGAFLLGFGAAVLICAAVWAVNRVWARKSGDIVPEEVPEVQEYVKEEDDDIIKGVPLADLPKVEYAIAEIFDGSMEDFSYIDDTNANRQVSMYWYEMAAQHGMPQAQGTIVRKKYESRDYAGTYMWAYVGNLCKDYIEHKGAEDLYILRQVYLGAMANFHSLAYSHTVGYYADHDAVDARNRLPASQLVSLEEEAKARFVKIKEFMDSQIKTYKQEHPED